MRHVLPPGKSTLVLFLPAIEPEPKVLVLDMQALAEKVVNLTDGGAAGEGGLVGVVAPRHRGRARAAHQPVVARGGHLHKLRI